MTLRVSWVAAAISEPAARARVRIWSGGESIVALAPAAGSGSSNATIVLPTGLDGGLGARLYVNASVVLENCYSSTVSDTMPPVDPNVGAFVELAVLEFLENGPMQTVVARCAQGEAAIATPIKAAHASPAVSAAILQSNICGRNGVQYQPAVNFFGMDYFVQVRCRYYHLCYFISSDL